MKKANIGDFENFLFLKTICEHFADVCELQLFEIFLCVKENKYKCLLPLVKFVNYWRMHRENFRNSCLKTILLLHNKIRILYKYSLRK